MKRLVPILLFMPRLAFGLLPLPYPVDPPDEELALVEGPARDPRSIQGYFELYKGSQLREMELPAFDDKTFTVPAPLKPRVEFWKRIFTEFTSDQMVMHDARYPGILYEVVDVSQINGDKSLSERARRRKLSRYLKPIRSRTADTLRFLHANRRDPLKIPVNLFPIFSRFQQITEEDKFEQAAKRVRAQQGQRDKLVRGFFFGGRYFPRMMEIFEEEGLPKELTRLTLVESAFDLSARSKVGASGVWQFMRATGKRYLRIDKAVDERNDPIAATWAAAQLLKSNYARLGTWPLAITAYNHGSEGMARAVAETGTRNLVAIIDKYEHRTFGFASSNFYTEFLAVLEVEREYRKHFGKLMVDAPLRYAEFSVTDNVAFEDLAQGCGMDTGELAVLNPALTDWALSAEGFVPQGYRLKVPPEKLEKCRSGYRNVTRIAADWARDITSEPEPEEGEREEDALE